MSRRFACCVCLCALGFVPSAWGQFFAWKWVQPWTPPWAAYESRVERCGLPTPLSRIALDDWICQRSGPIIRYSWWGTLSHPLQGRRPFYVAIYPASATACVPQLTPPPLYQVCLVPDVVRLVGHDCQDRPVYFLSGIIPAGTAPFTQVAGNHYWLQISEADAESIRPGLEDFRWSSHRPINLCPAVQGPAPLTQPLLDPCDQREEDLAFGLNPRDISGNVAVGGVIPAVLQLNLYTQGPAGPILRESMCVEPDPQGNFAVFPESPDGMYTAEMMGGGMRPIRQQIMLQEGTCARLSFFDIDIFYGDLNVNGFIDLPDLALLLAGFGR